MTALNVIDRRFVQALSKFYFERTLPFLFCSRHLLCPNSAAASSEGCICRPITSYSTSRGCPSSKTPSNAAFKAAPDGSFVARHVSCMHCSPAGQRFVWGCRLDRWVIVFLDHQAHSLCRLRGSGSPKAGAPELEHLQAPSHSFFFFLVFFCAL